MLVTFVGTGTSQGVPVPACYFDVCRYGGNTDRRLRKSDLLEFDDTIISIDAGSDFRYQM